MVDFSTPAGPKCAPCRAYRRYRMPLSLTLALGLLVGQGDPAAAEPVKLSAQEAQALVSGNTLVLEDPRRGYRMYYSEDGRYLFDPEHGLAVEGHWFARESDDQLCDWIVNPDKPACAAVAVDGDQVLFDWGDGWESDYASRLDSGDGTDLSDNPGPDFDPSRDLSLPADLEIRPPTGAVPQGWAEASGAWYGSWFAFLDYALIIEALDSDSVQIAYAWGPNKFDGGDPGWRRASGRIEAGELMLDMGGWTLSVRVHDGALELDGETRDWAGRTRAVRWADVPLTSPGARQVIAPDPSAARDQLTFWQLQIGEVIGEAPVHNDYFMSLGDPAPAQHRFEGRLTIGESKTLGRPAGSLRGRDHAPFPAFSADFITMGDRLVPRERGILKTSQDPEARWDIVLGRAGFGPKRMTRAGRGRRSRSC